jgi:predicted nucleic acid-binding protein
MSRFLLDTNILSEFNRRGEPDQRVKHWLEGADAGSLYASVLTFRKSDLHEWFEGRILPIDQPIADRWGSIRARAQLKGRPLSVIDALLAATAIQHELTIVSRNASHFSVVDLAVINPWER